MESLFIEANKNLENINTSLNQCDVIFERLSNCLKSYNVLLEDIKTVSF